MHEFELSVRVPRPFSFRLTVRKPAGWSWGAFSEVYEEDALITATRLPDGRLVGLKLRESAAGVAGTAFSKTPLGPSSLAVLARLLEVGLGVQDDLTGFYALRRRDPLVATLERDLRGMRLGFLTGVFERALLAVSLQMAPVSRSLAMMGCLTERYGESVLVDGTRIRYWPKAEKVARLPEETLAEECRLGYRAKSIRRIALSLSEGFPGVLDLVEMGETEALRVLRGLYGIGEYSAQIISPFLGFPLDVWSSRIFHELLFGRTPDDPRSAIRAVTAEAERRWGDFARYVFVYVLNDLPNLAEEYGITRLR